MPNPDFLYLTSKHQDALSTLEYGVMERVGFVLLTGDVGTGKTTLIRHLLNSVDPDIKIGLILNTNVTPGELIELLLREFGLTPEKGSRVENLDMLQRFLTEKYAEGRRVVTIIDEAQNLSDKVLEELRMISNLQSEEDLLLQILLVGQPELRDKLRSPHLASFAQRISAHYHLSALGREETVQYIAFRLARAGGSRPDLFTPGAVNLIHQAARGVPRTINLLCDAALVYGFADDLERIDERVIHQVIEDKKGLGLAFFAGPPESPPPKASPPPPKASPSPKSPGASKIAFKCRCGKKFVVAKTFAGKRAKCSACGARFTIPGAR
ncbi:MAG: AAA family ATPase [Desulfobacterales bacterium]|nr:AAA family ATPase [Desulfobacterales bacterium]